MNKYRLLLKNYFHQQLIEAGCDEAGRGCLAGPVFAAAVILPPDFYHPLLNDSKKVTEVNRNELRKCIEQQALAYGVARVNEEEIDRINILQASIKAMHLAIDQLKITPSFLLIDGNRFVDYQKIKHQCIIKGDELYTSIAAASILAKTWRDEYMLNLHSHFPYYDWNTNKGYGTVAHRRAIEKHGLCNHHRKSFQCLPAQLSLSI